MMKGATMNEGRFSKQAGVTLVELLIALVVNVFLIGALIAVFSTNLTHYNKTSKSDQLNDRMAAVMDVMSNDIRRAGYWVNAYQDLTLDQNNNPFMTSATDIQTGNSGTCILFAYDYDKNGVLPTISASYEDERYGFRLNGNAIQTRPRGATFSCSASASNWENITDPAVMKITALSFVINATKLDLGPGAITANTGLVIRSVDITVTGQLVSDTSVTQTLTQHVRVRNDKFVP